MSKYIKKPVIIDAVQYLGDPAPIKNVMSGVARTNLKINKDTNELTIKTLEGNMLVSLNDYVIKGVHGEFYPCKPDIFRETYNNIDGSAITA